MKLLFDKMARQASPLVIGRLVSAALTFCLPLWLARTLDPSGFGTYKQLFLVAQTVLLTCQLGLTQSLYYFLPRGGRRRGSFLAQVVIGLAFISLTAGALLWLAAPWIGRHVGDGALGALRVPLALLAGGLLFASPLESALTSEGRIGTAAVSYVTCDAVRTVLLLGGASHGIIGVAWAGAIYALLRACALVIAIATGFLPTARPSWPLLREQLSYALPFAGSCWLLVAQKQFGQYAISASFDAAAFAMFAVASFHLPVVDIIYTPISEVLMVRLGRARLESAARARAEWDDAIDKLATVLLPAAACAWLVGPQLLPLLFTKKYLGSVPLFLLATFEIPLWILPCDALLRATGETRFLFVWNAIRAVITGALILGGLHFFGMAGAIVGGIVSEAISRGVMLARGRRALGASLAEAVDLDGVMRIGAAAALAALPSYLVRYALGGKVGIAVTLVVYGLVYLGLRLAWAPRGRHDIALDAVPLRPPAHTPPVGVPASAPAAVGAQVLDGSLEDDSAVAASAAAQSPAG